MQQVGFLRLCDIKNITRKDIRLPGSIDLKGAGWRGAAVITKNTKPTKTGKPKVEIIEDEITVKKLEIIMDSNRNTIKEAKIFSKITYAHYRKQLQLAAKYLDLNHAKVLHRM